MNKATNANHPPIKDMPIDDAKAFIDAGWKAMPYLVAQSYPFVKDGMAVGAYEALLATAKNQPALQESFGAQALEFLKDHKSWATKVLPDLLFLARQEPKLAPNAIDASFDMLAEIKGLENGGLAYADNEFAWRMSEIMLETAQHTGTTAHLIQKGLNVLPASVKGTSYVITNTLFSAAKGNDADMRSIVLAVRDIMPAVKARAIEARSMIDLVVKNIGAYPHMLAEIMDEADETLRAVAHAHPGEGYELNSIENMLTVAKDDPALRRNIVDMGRNIVRAGHEVSGYGSERLFAMLYRAGKNDPAQLPDLIVTAWEYILPSFNVAIPSQFMRKMINDSRENPEVRNAHIECASFAVMKIANKDSWHVHSSLKLLRDILNLQDERRILSSTFAVAKFGRGRNEREIWFIPKDGDMLVVQGHAVSSINNIARHEAFANIPKLEQLGRGISGVLFGEMTPDEGRREIRKTTGLRFETLR